MLAIRRAAPQTSVLARRQVARGLKLACCTASRRRASPRFATLVASICFRSPSASKPGPQWVATYDRAADRVDPICPSFAMDNAGAHVRAARANAPLDMCLFVGA